MKSHQLECEKCGDLTKVKAADEKALVDWYTAQKKKGRDILCKKCRKNNNGVE